MREVNKAVRKKDAMELLLGKPVYTDDIALKDCHEFSKAIICSARVPVMA